MANTRECCITAVTLGERICAVCHTELVSAWGPQMYWHPDRGDQSR